VNEPNKQSNGNRTKSVINDLQTTVHSEPFRTHFRPTVCYRLVAACYQKPKYREEGTWHVLTTGHREPKIGHERPVVKGKLSTGSQAYSIDQKLSRLESTVVSVCPIRTVAARLTSATEHTAKAK
jgi:hypothetical protein